MLMKDLWWLIYSHEDIERNRSYIDLYFKYASEKGKKLELLESGSFSELPDKMPEAVINRSRNVYISKCFEEAGVRVYNSAKVAELGNDKLKAIVFAGALEIPVMRTLNERGDLAFPFVMKSRGGHGGKEVFLINNEEEYESLKCIKSADGSDFIFQEMASDTGKDLRIYTVGDEMIGSMMRISDTDFKSNYSLGGKAFVHELTDEERGIAEKIIEALHPGHIGIDLIYDHGRPVFNELEDAVGSRMLYRYTDTDAVRLYVDHIDRDIKKAYSPLTR